MKKRNKNAKGFTLVELVVVIAIIAILGAVSVVGYFAFIEKANLSNDQTMIKMINDNLQISEVERKPKSGSEALSDLYALGFDGNKLVPYSAKHHYAYNLEKNRFYLLDKQDNVIYPEDGVATSSLWGLYRSQDNDKITGVSKYIAMGPITSQGIYDTIIEDNYELDLNNFIVTVTNNKSNVTVLNGSVVNNSFTVKEGFEDTIDTKKVASASALDSSNIVVDDTTKTIEVKDYYVTEANRTNFLKYVNSLNDTTKGNVAKNIKLSKITYDGQNTDSSFVLDGYMGYEKVIIEDSTFVNCNKWGLKINNPKTVYEIRRNLFTNSHRGLNIAYDISGKPLTGADISIIPGTIIEENTFMIGNGAKDKAIQLASFYNENVQKDPSNPVITIRKNNIVSAYAVYNIHENIIHGAALKEQKRTVITKENFSKIFKFENNNYSGAKEVVSLDEAGKTLNANELTTANGLKTSLESIMA